MTTGGLIGTMPNPSPAPANRLRRRLLDAFLMLAAPAALFTALAPTSPVRVQVLAWTVFVLVLIVSALLDRRRMTRAVPRPTTQGKPAPDKNRPSRVPMGLALDQDDDMIDDWLGPFNPDNGLSLDIAPYFLHDLDDKGSIQRS